VLIALDWCGYRCAATGRAADAVTVWGARAALYQKGEYTEPPIRTRSRATVAGYALLLTAPGPHPAAAPALAGLSARERELVTLVAEGHTNAQIAAGLFISVRTVSSRLDPIRDKTGRRAAPT